MTVRCRSIEDDDDLSVMLKSLLEQFDIEVTSTTGDFEALMDKEKWKDYDAALIDLMLFGQMTGADLVRWLYANTNHIRIVILSAVADLSITDATALAHAVLIKPCSAQKLVEALGGTYP